MTLPSGLGSDLADILPSSKPWIEGWKVFGDEDSDRVDIIAEEGTLTAVRARIDARNMNAELLDALADIVDRNNCVFLNSAETREVVEHEVRRVAGLVKRYGTDALAGNAQVFDRLRAQHERDTVHYYLERGRAQ